MQQSMQIQDMLTEVLRRDGAKVDYIANTEDQVSMVQNPDDGELSIVLLKEGATELERFSINDTAHYQIAHKLGIPQSYYRRLCDDHPDMVLFNVNELFKRDPSMRMIRTIDGRVRAFLSNQYKAMDNRAVLEKVLPVIRSDFETTLLASNVGDDYMHIKCLFTGDELAHTITEVRGKARIIKPGFRLSNSETGKGSLKLETFFFDDYCTNGCVFGKEEAFTISKMHLGGKLARDDDLRVISCETHEKEFEYVVSALRDGLRTISDPMHVELLADRLRAAANTEPVKHPTSAVELAVKQLPILEREKESILNTFIRDQDFTKWGLASAVTEVANNPELASFDRICELEDIGGKILSFSIPQWNQYVYAEAA